MKTTYKVQITYEGRQYLVELIFDIGEGGKCIISFGKVYQCTIFGDPTLN